MVLRSHWSRRYWFFGSGLGIHGLWLEPAPLCTNCSVVHKCTSAPPLLFCLMDVWLSIEYSSAKRCSTFMRSWDWLHCVSFSLAWISLGMEWMEIKGWNLKRWGGKGAIEGMCNGEQTSAEERKYHEVERRDPFGPLFPLSTRHANGNVILSPHSVYLIRNFADLKNKQQQKQ